MFVVLLVLVFVVLVMFVVVAVGVGLGIVVEVADFVVFVFVVFDFIVFVSVAVGFEVFVFVVLAFVVFESVAVGFVAILFVFEFVVFVFVFVCFGGVCVIVLFNCESHLLFVGSDFCLSFRRIEILSNAETSIPSSYLGGCVFFCLVGCAGCVCVRLAAIGFFCTVCFGLSDAVVVCLGIVVALLFVDRGPNGWSCCAASCFGFCCCVCVCCGLGCSGVFGFSLSLTTVSKGIKVRSM